MANYNTDERTLKQGSTPDGFRLNNYWDVISIVNRKLLPKMGVSSLPTGPTDGLWTIEKFGDRRKQGVSRFVSGRLEEGQLEVQDYVREVLTLKIWADRWEVVSRDEVVTQPVKRTDATEAITSQDSDGFTNK